MADDNTPPSRGLMRLAETQPDLFFMLAVLTVLVIVLVAAFTASAFGFLKPDLVAAFGLGGAIGGLIGVLGRPSGGAK